MNKHSTNARASGALMQFKWQVHRRGYSWARVSGLEPVELKPYVLSSRGAETGQGSQRTYDPSTEEPGLFRAFASTRCAPKDILRFANRYGRLAGSVEHDKQLTITTPGQRDSLHTVEPLRAWVSEILFMREMVDLWTAAQIGNERAIRKRIVWQKNIAYYQNRPIAASLPLPPPPPCFSPHAQLYTAQLEDSLRSLRIHGWVVHPDRDAREVIRSLKSEWVEVALYFIALVVNAKLSDHKIEGPRLAFIGHEQLGWRGVPNSLIGFLWLQFADAIATNRHFKQCLQCHSWFEMAQNLARADKVYCSQACRVRAYRARQAEARELYSLGSSLDELAHRFGSDIKTIRAWLDN